MSKVDVFGRIVQERDRQDVKWGEQNHDNLYWLGILIEEVGELARDIIEGEFRSDTKEPAEKELVQVAAVAVSWLESLERRSG